MAAACDRLVMGRNGLSKTAVCVCTYIVLCISSFHFGQMFSIVIYLLAVKSYPITNIAVKVIPLQMFDILNCNLSLCLHV